MKPDTKIVTVRVAANALVRYRNEEADQLLKGLSICLFTTLIVTISLQRSFGQVALIKDLNKISSANFNTDHSLTQTGDRMYYIDNNQLWMSNGNAAATSMLKSFNSISDLRPVGRNLYFTADDGVSGEELWRTNGTMEGTVRVKDINPGLVASSPSAVCVVMGKLFFAATHASYGRELWVSDGTSEGTLMVRDIRKGRGNSNPGGLTQMNGMVYFSANDGNRGFELWTSNGTSAGTHIVRDIVSAYKLGSNPKWLTNSNDILYFTATHPNTGLELWKTDGTSAGSVRVKDIRPGSQGSGIRNLINVKGTLFFTANDGVHGHELWKSNGNADNTVLVRDLNPGPGGSNSSRTGDGSMTDIKGILYFAASKGSNDFIWRSDGTLEGTFQIQTSYPTSINPILPAFTHLNGKVYFFNSRQRYDPYYLYSMDYKGDTPSVVKEFTRADSFYNPFHQEMISFEGKLFTFGRLMTSSWQDTPFKFIRSDGTDGGTVVIKDVETSATLGSNPFRMVRTDNLVYMQTMAETSQYPGKYELFRTDGTAEGTFRIMEVQEHSEMVASGNRFFFGTQEESGGVLYVTEGTPATTTRLTWQSSMTNGTPSMLTEVNGMVYFGHNYTFEGRPYAMFWKSDGTPEGTRMLQGVTRINSITRVAGKVIVIGELDNGELYIFKTIKTRTAWVASIPSGGSKRSAYQPTAVVDLVMYFVATDGTHGNEIWRTDGTPTGTYMLFDFNPDDPVNQYEMEDDIRALIAVKKSLYFNARGADNQWGLYKYLTPSSHEKVADMPPVVHSFVVNRLMYLFTESEHPGTLNVWVSDGTPAGTGYLTSISSYQTIDHAVLDGIVYFSSPESPHMFRTDGTACGTSAVSTGLDHAFPIEPFGSALVFGASSPQTGMEPFIYHDISLLPAPACDLTMDAVANSARTTFTPYPNPFTDEFTVRVEGEEEAAVSIDVKSLQGLNIETLTGLKMNTDYDRIGGAWPKGIYVARVLVNDRMTTHLLVKK